MAPVFCFYIYNLIWEAGSLYNFMTFIHNFLIYFEFFSKTSMILFSAIMFEMINY